MDPTEAEHRRTSVHDAKVVAFYSSVVQAWITTRMERNRALLNLSAGGIGLLATLLTTRGPLSEVQFWLYLAAAISFAGAIIFALLVFDRNSPYLRDVSQGKPPKGRWLTMFDRCLFSFFMLGVLLTGALGVLSGYNRIREDSKMTQGNPIKVPDHETPERVDKNVADIEDLSPKRGQAERVDESVRTNDNVAGIEDLGPG